MSFKDSKSGDELYSVNCYHKKNSCISQPIPIDQLGTENKGFIPCIKCLKRYGKYTHAMKNIKDFLNDIIMQIKTKVSAGLSYQLEISYILDNFTKTINFLDQLEQYETKTTKVNFINHNLTSVDIETTLVEIRDTILKFNNTLGPGYDFIQEIRASREALKNAYCSVKVYESKSSCVIC